MECLLSYIEFTQFQKVAQEQIDANEDEENEDKGHLCLPSLIPTSSTMSTKKKNDENGKEIDNVTDLKTKAHKIYNKYIKIGCEFEVNIDYHLRTNCKNIMENLDDLLDDDSIKIEDIFNLFGKVKKEMVQLLQWSLIRFKEKTEFEKIVDLFVSV